MFALFEAGGRERPVSASEVAAAVWDGEQTHGDIIRLGQRLGMLASVGLVGRHKIKHAVNRWKLPAGEKEAPVPT